ncbi:MAG: hypothetical protein K6G26_13505 [Lachnospiraceae bacterium]|nr:hypothetical protein [Lachnospiraceae bacterium]
MFLGKVKKTCAFTLALAMMTTAFSTCAFADEAGETKTEETVTLKLVSIWNDRGNLEGKRQPVEFVVSDMTDDMAAPVGIYTLTEDYYVTSVEGEDGLTADVWAMDIEVPKHTDEEAVKAVQNGLYVLSNGYGVYQKTVIKEYKSESFVDENGYLVTVNCIKDIETEGDSDITPTPEPVVTPEPTATPEPTVEPIDDEDVPLVPQPTEEPVATPTPTVAPTIEPATIIDEEIPLTPEATKEPAITAAPDSEVVVEADVDIDETAVPKATTAPKTADVSVPYLYISMVIASACGLVVLYSKKEELI